MDNPYYSIGLKRYIEIQKVLVEEYKDTLAKELEYNGDLSMNYVYMDYISSGKAKEFRDKFVKYHSHLEYLNDCGKLETMLKEHDHKNLMSALQGKYGDM